ncbi:putative aminopeptidase [Rosa chinensis]|uniref:Putative aminopeptidase n=1 Tax=Rosa chinensis TaxID=74649 RepID=A0A2P6QAR3_ROSCH|nr:putative aminopeptidase [Rosa chinensis]
MKLAFATKEIDVTKWKEDLLAVGVTEKDLRKDQNSKFENPILKKLDSCLGGVLAEVSTKEDFTRKSGQSTGLGEPAAAAAKTAQASDIAIVLASSEGLSANSCKASAIASGAVLGIYEDNRYKSESKKPALKSVDILGLRTGPELEKKLKYAQDVASGIILGKELTNSPANVLTPGSKLAEEASNIASLYSDVLSAKTLNEEQCKDLKIGSYLAVAAASANPPYFIQLTYKPPGEPAKLKLALVGKGLTFDR